MEANGTSLTAVKALQELAASEYAKSGSPRRAARKAKVSVQTVESWLKDKNFNTQVLVKCDALLQEFVCETLAAGAAAMRYLHRDLKEPEGKLTDAPDVDIPRLRTAKAILEHYAKAVELYYLINRIKKSHPLDPE